MEIITFESKAYKALDNKITAIADYIFNHAEMAKHSEDDMWVDSYEVCTFLKKMCIRDSGNILSGKRSLTKQEIAEHFERSGLLADCLLYTSN